MVDVLESSHCDCALSKLHVSCAYSTRKYCAWLMAWAETTTRLLVLERSSFSAESCACAVFGIVERDLSTGCDNTRLEGLVLVIRCHHLDSAHHVHSSHNLHSARRDPPQLGALDLNGFLPQSMHQQYAPRVCTKSMHQEYAPSPYQQQSARWAVLAVPH